MYRSSVESWLEVTLGLHSLVVFALLITVLEVLLWLSMYRSYVLCVHSFLELIMLCAITDLSRAAAGIALQSVQRYSTRSSSIEHRYGICSLCLCTHQSAVFGAFSRSRRCGRPLRRSDKFERTALGLHGHHRLVLLHHIHNHLVPRYILNASGIGGVAVVAVAETITYDVLGLHTDSDHLVSALSVVIVFVELRSNYAYDSSTPSHSLRAIDALSARTHTSAPCPLSVEVAVYDATLLSLGRSVRMLDHGVFIVKRAHRRASWSLSWWSWQRDGMCRLHQNAHRCRAWLRDHRMAVVAFCASLWCRCRIGLALI